MHTANDGDFAVSFCSFYNGVKEIFAGQEPRGVGQSKDIDAAEFDSAVYSKTISFLFKGQV